MTKDEDDWLSDFLELAQAPAQQSQMTLEKDYTARLKLLSPRIERARLCDADAELAKKVAASEALAGQKKFDAATDQLDAAFVFAGRLLEAAATAAAAESAVAAPESLELASLTDEAPSEKAPETQETDLDAMLQELPSAEEAVAEKPVDENPVTDLDAMLQELPSAEESTAEKPVEETAETDLDAMLRELPSAEETAAEIPIEIPATETMVPPDSDADHSEKKERPS